MGLYDRYGVDDDTLARAQANWGALSPAPSTEPPAGAIDTRGPMTPEEQAFAAGSMANDARAEAAAVQGGFSHGDTMPAPPGARITGPGLDWQPPVAKAPYVDVAPPQATPSASPHPMAMGVPTAYGSVYRPGSSGIGPNPYKAIARESGQAAQRAQAGLGAAENEYAESMGGQMQAAEDTASAQAEQADARSRGAVASAAISEEQHAHDQAALQAHLATVDRLSQEQRDLHKEIGRFEIKDRRTTGQRVMGALAVALSGLGDAFNAAGGIQSDHAAQAAEMIQRGIDRDIELQKVMLDNKKTEALGKNTELGWAMQRFGDVKDAEKAAYVMKMTQAANVMESEVQRGMSKEATARGMATVQALRTNAANTWREIQEGRYWKNSELERQAKLAEYQQKRAAAAGHDPLKRLKQIADIEKTRAETDKLRGEAAGGGKAAEADIPGYTRTKAVSPSSVTEANKVEGARRALDESLTQLEQLRQRNAGGVGWSPADSRAAETIIGNMADTASQMAGGGQAGEAAKKEIRSLIPNPTDYAFTADPMEVYARVRSGYNSVARSRLRGLGYEAQDQGPNVASLVRPGAAR